MLWKRRSAMGAGLVGLTGLFMPETLWAAPAPLAIPDGAGPIPEAWEKAERIPLWPQGVPGRGFAPRPRGKDWPPTFLSGIEQPDLRLFRPRQSNGRAVLVIPGGAYNFVSIRNEGVDVANALTARGYTAYVLTYRLPGEGWAERWDVPLQDAQRAMRIIRSHAAKMGFDASAIRVIGFSAGGHLAASLLTAYDEHLLPRTDVIDDFSPRPDSVALIYPVIAMTAPYAHAWSAETLLGPSPSERLIQRRSPALHVTKETAPTFLVHALDDPAVPYQNSLMMSEALTRVGHAPEMHLFAEGGHGFGLGPSNAPAGQWLALWEQWEQRC